MSIRNMHYDYKAKLNKNDSQKYRNLRPQEIDWALNEALGIFIKTIAEPRLPSPIGFEVNQRTIDDIRVYVIENKEVTTSVFDSKSHRVALPSDYWFLVSSYAVGKTTECEDILITNQVQHDDRHEESPLNNSSFEWRETNYRFYSEGIRFFTDGKFTIPTVYLDYIRVPKYIHFAAAVPGGSYRLPSGVLLTGEQDCELPVQLHGEVVDLAVLITTGKLQIPDYQIKQAKVNLNN